MSNNNNERKSSLSSNLLSKHFSNLHHKNNDHRNRASSSSGSSSNSIKVGNNEGLFQQQIKNKDQNTSSQFTKSIGMSNLSNGVGYSSFSPQDYLNNPMFDSLNNHHRRYWPSQDRTITLRPLTSKKHSLHRKMMTPRSACKVLS